MNLYEKLEAIFLKAAIKAGKSKHRLLLNAGIDPAQYRAYKRANRPMSDEMIERLGECAEIPVSADRMKAWKVIDLYGQKVIDEAVAELKAG